MVGKKRIRDIEAQLRELDARERAAASAPHPPFPPDPLAPPSAESGAAPVAAPVAAPSPAEARPPLLAQTFLAALPIVLTIGLGFIATYYQSLDQHREELAVMATQGRLDRDKQALLARDADRARQAEADRAFTLQERDAAAQLARQAREFDANAAAARERFTLEQVAARHQDAAQRSQQAREFAQSLERQRRESEVEIILKASEVPTSLPAEQQDIQRARNLLWFADAGYIAIPGPTLAKLREAGRLAKGQAAPLPVVQAAGNTAAIADFQRRQAITTDGMVGPVTCSKVFAQETAAAGSTDPTLLAGCRTRFPGMKAD